MSARWKFKSHINNVGFPVVFPNDTLILVGDFDELADWISHNVSYAKDTLMEQLQHLKMENKKEGTLWFTEKPKVRDYNVRDIYFNRFSKLTSIDIELKV